MTWMWQNILKVNFYEILGCATMGYPLSNQISSYAHAKLHLRVAMIFPDSLIILKSVRQVLFFLLVCLALKVTDWYTRTFYDINDNY